MATRQNFPHRVKQRRIDALARAESYLNKIISGTIDRFKHLSEDNKVDCIMERKHQIAHLKTLCYTSLQPMTF